MLRPAPSTRPGRMAASFASGAGLLLLRVALNLLAMPLLVRLWEREVVGVYFLTVGLAVSFQLLAQPLGQGLLRELAPALLARRDDAAGVFWTGLWIYGTAGLAAALAGAAALWCVLPGDTTVSSQDAVLWSALLVPLLWVQFLKFSLATAVQALGKHYRIDAVQAAAQVAAVAGTLVLAWRGEGITAVLVWLVAIEAACAAAQWLNVRAVAPELPLRPRPPALPLARRLLGYSGQILLGTLAAVVIWRSDELLIGRLLGVAQVAVYGAAMRVFLLLWMLVLLPGRTLQAEFARLQAGEADPLPRCRRLAFSVTRYLFAAFAVAGLPATLLAEPLLTRVLSPDYAGGGGVLAVLAASCLWMIPYHCGWHYHVVQGRYRHNLAFIAAVAAVNVAAVVLVAGRYGLMGVALAKAAAFLLFCPILQRAVRRSLGFKAATWWRSVGLPCYGILGLAVACDWGVLALLPVSSETGAAGVLLRAALLASVNLVLCFKLGAAEDEYQWLHAALRGRVALLRLPLALLRPLRLGMR